MKRSTSNKRFSHVLSFIATFVVTFVVAFVVFVSADSESAHCVPNNPTISSTPSENLTNDFQEIQEELTEIADVNVATNNMLAPVENNSEKNIITVENEVADEPETEEILPLYDGEFELPLVGAHAYPSVVTELYSVDGSVITQLEPGCELEILGIDGDEKWIVRNADGMIGSIYHLRCMINLADIIPSIVYNNTNSSSAIYRSSGYDIPNVTGEKLYDVRCFNNRLGEDEYVMAILFSAAKKVMAAQHLALAEGYSLCIYETFRPLETQQLVCSNLKKLSASNSAVQKGITGNGWSESWFIAQGTSNHQRGYAMDVSLIKVVDTEQKTACGYSYIDVIEYEETTMPSSMHELSDASVVFAYGVSSKSDSAWKSVPLSSSVTDAAILLQKYCTEAGFTPLASEWWHFNDLDAKNAIGKNASDGNYYLQVGTNVM